MAGWLILAGAIVVAVLIPERWRRLVVVGLLVFAVGRALVPVNGSFLGTSVSCGSILSPIHSATGAIVCSGPFQTVGVEAGGAFILAIIIVFVSAYKRSVVGAVHNSGEPPAGAKEKLD